MFLQRLRPEDIEDAAFVPDAPAANRIKTAVELREALGSEVVVHVEVKAPPAMTEEARELAKDIGEEAVERTNAQARGGTTTVLARLNPRTAARKGQPIELAVDTTSLHFFDPTDGSSIRDESAP